MVNNNLIFESKYKKFQLFINLNKNESSDTFFFPPDDAHGTSEYPPNISSFYVWIMVNVRP